MGGWGIVLFEGGDHCLVVYMEVDVLARQLGAPCGQSSDRRIQLTPVNGEGGGPGKRSKIRGGEPFGVEIPAHSEARSICKNIAGGGVRPGGGIMETPLWDWTESLHH